MIKKEETKKQAVDKEDEKDEGPKFHNCFVHMGKMYNLSFLNVPPKIRHNKVSFSSGLLDVLDQETELQK